MGGTIPQDGILYWMSRKSSWGESKQVSMRSFFPALAVGVMGLAASGSCCLDSLAIMDPASWVKINVSPLRCFLSWHFMTPTEMNLEWKPYLASISWEFHFEGDSYPRGTYEQKHQKEKWWERVNFSKVWKNSREETDPYFHLGRLYQGKLDTSAWHCRSSSLSGTLSHCFP